MPTKYPKKLVDILNSSSKYRNLRNSVLEGDSQERLGSPIPKGLRGLGSRVLGFRNTCPNPKGSSCFVVCRYLWKL